MIKQDAVGVWTPRTPPVAPALEVLIENANTLYPDDWKLQGDNSSIHRSKLSTAYKDFRGIRTIDRPSNNPDLNPMRKYGPCLCIESRMKPQAAFAKWKKHNQRGVGNFCLSFLRNFNHSMRKRCNLVIASGGKKINY